MNPCYDFCNKMYGISEPSMRLYCKKGCDGDGDNMTECKKEFCSSLCIKDALGEEDDKKGQWTQYFARAPIDSDACLGACIQCCSKKDYNDDD